MNLGRASVSNTRVLSRKGCFCQLFALWAPVSLQRPARAGARGPTAPALSPIHPRTEPSPLSRPPAATQVSRGRQRGLVELPGKGGHGISSTAWHGSMPCPPACAYMIGISCLQVRVPRSSDGDARDPPSLPCLQRVWRRPVWLCGSEVVVRSVSNQCARCAGGAGKCHGLVGCALRRDARDVEGR